MAHFKTNSDWMFQVMCLFITNQSALFQRGVAFIKFAFHNSSRISNRRED